MSVLDYETWTGSDVALTLSPPQYMMEFCKVVLTFASVDEILWSGHSNETTSAVLSHGNIVFQHFTK